jgi:2-polyprenyl-3-methyl-5-hydroxy-6-metoxy-1,4-benzoquinol methylase
MDQPDLDAGEHHRALRALARINWLSASARILWPAMRNLCRERAAKGDATPVRVLDVATGGGDVPVRLWHKARRANLSLEVAGCDFSSVAIEHARTFATAHQAKVDFFTLDVLAASIPRDYDVITSSLFLHHLADKRLRSRSRDSAGELAVVNASRGRTGWLAAFIGSRVLTRSPTVHTDATLSVEGAFTPNEALELARRAGWNGATVQRKFPFRYLLSWRRT